MTETVTTETRQPDSPHCLEWDDLFWRMLRGDDKAFEPLFAAFNGKLRRFFARQLGTGAHVDDLAQEVWVRFINLRTRPPQPGLFRVQAFLFRVARNLSIDYLRTRKEHTALDDLPEQEHPTIGERDTPAGEALVMQALDELPDESREILVLNLYLGYRFDEIAEMLDKSPDAIWQRASRARAKLRRIIIEMAKRDGISLREFITPELQMSDDPVRKSNHLFGKE
jgi:RNA polymerase sigma-70 factor (ECF subfamily)